MSTPSAHFPPRRTRIVIVGGGYAGAYCARALERLLKRRLRRGSDGGADADGVDLLLIDRNNFFVIYPLLIEAGTGSLEPRHAVVSIRSFLKRASFRMGDATSIDLERQLVRVRLGGFESEPSSAETEFEYDHLVLAPGSVTLRPHSIPGLREHALDVKGLSDAVALRDRAIRMLEFADACADPARRAATLQVAVVGASFTGAEVAGEFDDFMKRAARRYPNLRPSDVRITLIERSDRILRALPERLSRYAERSMRKRGIDIRLNESVREIGDDHVVLASGERLAARTTIWCAGVAPPPLVERLALPKDERGYLVCEADGRVRGFENVWAIGDCAANPAPPGSDTPIYPSTAQHAIREGEMAAANLARVLRGEPTLAMDYRTKGSAAALGCRTGVAEVMGVTLSGFPAWWFWRTLYLLKMPGLARKVRVATDWTLDLFFPRDDVQLGVHGGERR
jgi:NADH dehydrogenase